MKMGKKDFAPRAGKEGGGTSSEFAGKYTQSASFIAWPLVILK